MAELIYFVVTLVSVTLVSIRWKNIPFKCIYGCIVCIILSLISRAFLALVTGLTLGEIQLEFPEEIEDLNAQIFALSCAVFASGAFILSTTSLTISQKRHREKVLEKILGLT